MLRCARKTYKLMRVEKIPDSNPLTSGDQPLRCFLAMPPIAYNEIFPQQSITAQLSKKTPFLYKQQKNKSAVSVKIILISLQLIKRESPEEPGIY